MIKVIIRWVVLMINVIVNGPKLISAMKPKCPCSEQSCILLDWVYNSSNNNSYLLIIRYCIIIVAYNTPSSDHSSSNYNNCSTNNDNCLVHYFAGLALFLMAGRVFLMADIVC